MPILVLLFVFVARPAARSTQSQINSIVPVPVAAVTARRGDIGVYFFGLGTVTPVYTDTIKSRVDGQILKVLYKESQGVHKADPLIEIDPRPYEAQLEQHEGQLAKDKAALEMAKIDLQRYQTLLPKNAIPEQNVADQRATVRQDEGAVRTDEGNIAADKLNITYCHITAPIDGIVGLRLVDPGNMIYAASGTALVVITQIRPITVIFTLPEQQLSAVLKQMREGEKLSVDAFDSDSKTLIGNGQLTGVDNQIDQTTGTLKLRATFANRDNNLFPNQFVNARILVDQKKSVVLVPNAAIQRNGSNTFVYAVKPDHKVTVRQVTVGTADATQSEITSGVTPGDVLVIQGVDKLQEGSLVQPQIQPSQTAATLAADSSKNQNGNTTSASSSRPSPGW